MIRQEGRRGGKDGETEGLCAAVKSHGTELSNHIYQVSRMLLHMLLDDEVMRGRGYFR